MTNLLLRQFKNLDLVTFGVEEINEVQMQEIDGSQREEFLYCSIGSFISGNVICGCFFWGKLIIFIKSNFLIKIFMITNKLSIATCNKIILAIVLGIIIIAGVYMLGYAFGEAWANFDANITR